MKAKKYEKGGKLKKSNPKMEKPKGYKEKSKKMGVSTLEERQAAKFKKFEKGGQVPPKGKKLTKEMVDKQHSSDLAKSMNLTNELAKKASTGLKDNGFPMSKAAKKALAKDVEKRKKRESTTKPNYRDVGKSLPGGESPRFFKKGGKVATTASKKEAFKNRALESSSEKLKGYKEKSKKMGVSTLEERQAERKAARKAVSKYKMGGKMKKYLKGGQVKLDANKDGKITGSDFMMLRKK